MKVLFVQPYFGFSGVISDTLPGYLAKRGHIVEVVGYVRDKERIHSFSENENIRFHFVEALNVSIANFITEFPYFLHLDKVIGEIDPEIVHINNLPFLTTYQSVRMAQKLRIKSLVHVHGVMAERNFLINKLQQLYLNSIGRTVFRDATKIICLTNKDAEKICNYGCPRSKIAVIPNGVDVNMFKPEHDKEGEGLIIWLGRFVHEKGLIYLLKAIKMAVNSTSSKEVLRLLLIGDGPIKSNIELLVRDYNLKDIVNVMPTIDHARVPEYLRKGSIVVLPSLKEGMPYIVLEAMACGRPVIGSDISGINDVITDGENGILVPPRDSKALAHAILLLLEDEDLRRELGKNATQLMVEKYDWKIICEKIEKIYYEAIQETM